VKGLTGDDLVSMLKDVIINITKRTTLRVVAWGSDNGPSNSGCRNKLMGAEKAFPWTFPNPVDPLQFIIITADSSHLLKKFYDNWINRRKLRVKLGLFSGLNHLMQK
jgi:hypothetical protein